MFKDISKNRYSILLFFSSLFILISFLLRIVFLVWVKNDFDWGITSLLLTILFGLLYDISIVSCFTLIITLYFAVLPNRYINSFFDKIFIYFIYTLYLVIIYFTFFAEVTFWDEFKSRFNFIAVDYLIYTYEVVKNIQESYPLPLLIGGIILITCITILVTKKRKYLFYTFHSRPTLIQKIGVFIFNLLIASSTLYFLNNDTSSISENRYNNEISKAGIFSFFSAFRNNHLKYDEHYTSISIEQAFVIVKNELQDSKTIFDQEFKNPLRRTILAPNPTQPEQKPNVIFVLMESMSASFLQEQFNEKPITPNLNKLADNSIYFSNMYANGTRTVRGMEAVILSIPPTPGHSIVKRVDNQNLYTISNVFKEKGYHNMFFYGGDGYFDNMNAFFGGNGFDIYDRGRGSILSDKINTHRYNINDDEVTFENAWGIADDDIYRKVIKVADQQYLTKQPFFAMVMSTSNHKPYTYEDGKIDIPSGTGRAGAVKYSDYAIGDFLAKAKEKPWFSNTVFVFIADHCASSAGKNAIDVKNHHIPAFIYNMRSIPNQKITKEVSQIDIFPTLFSLLNWNYTSQFYGKDIFDPEYNTRSFIGTYIKLGMKKNEDVIILSDQKKINQYKWIKDSLDETKMDIGFEQSIISNYQTADYLFSNKLLDEK
ncbi:LTA synthase family protein [Myroides indicus]|uniref:Phosphoglycerol transferase MdoB-like AlkP superfamily enzyme n=1 Tax=Myroides indicus TaxID=1323422 RepID=A0A4R7ETS7_9FLAO|nr:alkaline phosphatase family protein [Myroides indicus]TDS52433.1 phosphoglycerol transferase MdoB-like AlkP superfamily enzyme [Myroides indicus]